MTLRASKPAFNVREKLTELGRRFGLKGSELAAAETVQEARDLVSAGRKNLIINGAMQVAQRGTSVATGAVPNANQTYYTCDRFGLFGIGTDNAQWTNSQSTDAPEGFSNSWKWDCTTADASPDTSARQQISQVIEAQDLQHLNYGSNNPKEITLSFWVKATKPGINYIFIYHHDAADFIAHRYYINKSNTWEKKTITLTGGGAGTINNDNGAGLQITWLLYVGSTYTNGTYEENTWVDWTGTKFNMFENQTNHADSTSNDFYLTGVQLEVGRNATEFDYRSYGEELALCQRYFQGWNAKSSTERAATGIFVYDDEGNSSANQTTIIGSGSVVDSDDARIYFSLPVSMRTKPTIDIGDLRLITGSTLHNTATTIQYNNSTIHSCSMMVDNGGGMTAGQCVHLIIKGNGYFYLDAEF